MTTASERPVIDGYAITSADEVRFWEKVDRDSDPNGCWLFTSGKNTANDGYGAINLGGAPQRAHRVAWVLTKEPIPEGLVVRHGPQCEGRPGREGRRCVNPNHLAVGTQAQNHADKDGGWFRLDFNDIPMSGSVRDAAKAFFRNLVPDADEAEASAAEPQWTPKGQPSST